jgi:hypothetical protein
VALELGPRRADGVDEAAVVEHPHEVGDHLGVGLRRESLAVGDEAAPQLRVVLDDPVQDDGDLVVVTRGERVGVLLGDAPVGGPARVADAGRGPVGMAVDLALEVLELAYGLDRGQPVAVDQADAGRVIAPVLEALQALQQPLLGVPPAHVSDYSAHSSSVSREVGEFSRCSRRTLRPRSGRGRTGGEVPSGRRLWLSSRP